MQRAYTPILYYLNPRVVYDGSEVSFLVDPRSAQNYRLPRDLPFVEARINNSTINFEDFHTEDDSLNAWTKNSVRGTVHEIKPSPSASVNMKFRVGNSLHDESQMYTCSIDNTTCYKVKVVPVIHSISESSGYTTGG